MVSSNNLNTKINAPFIMQAHHALGNFFSYEKLVWTCIQNEQWYLEVHIFSFLFFYLFIYFFFEEKKWPSFISTHQNLLLVPLQSHLECSLSPLFYSQMGLASSLKSLVNWLKKISSFNPHWALGEPTHPCLWFVGFQNLPKAWIGS